MTPRRSTGRPPRRRARALAPLLACLLLLALMATGYAGTALVVSHPLQRVDAVISLASHEWERLPLAARLAAVNPDAIVVLTEPEDVNQFNCHDCAHRVDRLQHLGVAKSRVRVLRITHPGTHGEALAALEFARYAGIRHLMIATSPYHTRRTLATFRKVFENTEVEIGIEPAMASSRAQPARWWWQPDDRAYVPYEWAAIAYYAWQYGVWAFSTAY